MSVLETRGRERKRVAHEAAERVLLTWWCQVSHLGAARNLRPCPLRVTFTETTNLTWSAPPWATLSTKLDCRGSEGSQGLLVVMTTNRCPTPRSSGANSSSRFTYVPSIHWHIQTRLFYIITITIIIIIIIWTLRQIIFSFLSYSIMIFCHVAHTLGNDEVSSGQLKIDWMQDYIID